jgi:hypothetical protein
MDLRTFVEIHKLSAQVRPAREGTQQRQSRVSKMYSFFARNHAGKLKVDAEAQYRGDP